MSASASPDEVLAFWREAGPARWFTRDEAFDARCRERFLAAQEAAARGDLDEWELTPEGALAVVLLLDQLPRNMFRGTRRAYATDAAALLAADRALGRGHDGRVDPGLRAFLYIPFMHAEDLRQQQRGVALFEGAGDRENLKWARHHRDIVARFGRFPHRNAILGRESTPEEVEFLERDGFRG